jgi:heat-inducible transcriptional repressor
MVDHRVVEADEDYPQEELDRVSSYLSETFRGLTLEQIRARLIAMMSEEKSLYDRLMREALELSARSFDAGGTRDELIVDGTANILDHREFGDVENMKALFHAFEEKSRLVVLLNRCLEADGSRLFFGSETGTGGIEGVTLIASPYREGGRPLGTLGIVGPTRMQYSRAIALVETLARLLSEVLGEAGGQARAGAATGGRDPR